MWGKGSAQLRLLAAPASLSSSTPGGEEWAQLWEAACNAGSWMAQPWIRPSWRWESFWESNLPFCLHTVQKFCQPVIHPSTGERGVQYREGNLAGHTLAGHGKAAGLRSTTAWPLAVPHLQPLVLWRDVHQQVPHHGCCRLAAAAAEGVPHPLHQLLGQRQHQLLRRGRTDRFIAGAGLGSKDLHGQLHARMQEHNAITCVCGSVRPNQLQSVPAACHHKCVMFDDVSHHCPWLEPFQLMDRNVLPQSRVTKLSTKKPTPSCILREWVASGGPEGNTLEEPG